MTIHSIKVVFASLLLFLPIGIIAQGTARMFDNNNQTVYFLRNGTVEDSIGRVIYTISGNTVFHGDSRERNRIAYLIKSRDVFAREIGYIYAPDGTEVLFTIHKGRFFYRTGRFQDQLLLTMDNNFARQVVMKDGKSGEKTATAIGTNLTNTDLVALFLAWADQAPIQETIRQKQHVQEEALNQNVKGIIKLNHANRWYHEWEWDGRVLKPRWGARPEDEWIFDGEIFRPYWGRHITEEWKWDGTELKPFWEDIPALTFTWDGHSIKPMWDYREEDDWIITDSLAYPRWNRHIKFEWRIEGEVPIPVIAMVILGFADR